MSKINKKELSEIDICDLFITPAVKDAGWDQMQQIRREVTLTPGPVIVRGNLSSRNKKKQKFADYVLQWEAGVPIAIIEALCDTLKSRISDIKTTQLILADSLTKISVFDVSQHSLARAPKC